MRLLSPIDFHAHLDATIPQFELRQLGAVVFAATRSLDEADDATLRNDEQTIWGVGCHPGLAEAQKAFERKRFSALIQRTSFVGEVGLDGSSKVLMNTQQATFKAILQELENTPRIVSIHSYMATDLVINALETRPKTKGVVLHWWLGDVTQTRRALELGCFFSINASSVKRTDVLKQIPLDRVLTETDHPFGDRRGGRNARPGLVTGVESELAQHYTKTPEAIRLAIWDNLARLTSETGCMTLLPRAVRLQLMAR
jgi:TatD DNase family protein